MGLGGERGRKRSRRGYLRTLAVIGTATLSGCRGGRAPAISVPPEMRIDDPISPVVTGLSTDRATVTAETDARTAVGRLTWRSRATFDTRAGRVDPARQAPRHGAYRERDSAGLYWTMTPTASPRSVAFTPQTHEVVISVREPGDTTSAATTQTRRVLPVLEREPVGGEIVGTVFRPSSDGPHPGVVLLHGSGGVPLRRRARLLADHGYVVAAITYVGSEAAIPDHLVEVPVEYVQRAIDRLLADDRVAGTRVGLYGLSKGGELALLVGSLSDRVGAVVSVAGSGLVWPGNRRGAVAETSSWSRDGDPIPYVPIPRERYDPTGSRSTYAAGIDAASRARIDAATIPVERIDGPVVLVSGDDDGLWSSGRYSAIAADRLTRAGRRDGMSELRYEHAGHAITPPHLPTYGLSRFGETHTGGTPAGNAAAAAGHWEATLSAFATALRV